jgi:GTP-binding protein EngB required for normal cell division
MQKEILDELDARIEAEWAPIEIIPLGNTNVGKSTLLTKITGMFGLLNTSINRETSCLWRYMLNSKT